MTELFKSTHEALVFALNYSSQQYALSPVAKMMKTGVTGTGKGLVSTDGAAQAGLILAAFSKMDKLKAHCIIARHAPKFTECACCGGPKPTQQWRESITALRDWSMSTFSGLSHSVVREAIVMNFYSRGVSMDEAAKRANVPVKTVYNQRAKIHEALKVMDNQAQMEIADILQASGIVLGDETAEEARQAKRRKLKFA